MTRPAILSALLLITATVHPLPKTPQRVSYEAPPQMMRNIMALLDAAREFGVRPEFAFSFTWAESELKEWAVARRWREVDGKMTKVITARGLTQTNPKYQDKLVLKYLPGMHPKNFQWWNPVHSARLGCAMMADYVARFGEWGALACYNAGEGRYRQLWNGRRLPQETIDYQRKVLG